MRATKGAIESCTIDTKTMAPHFEVIGSAGTKAVGLCGSGLIDFISELFRCGIISPNGKFIRDGNRIKRDEFIASYIVAVADETETDKNIELNEIDIDKLFVQRVPFFQQS
jgi:uncharacterized 2Fe-2S/4Fe-4S cluster protein (DUF4445 family)